MSVQSLTPRRLAAVSVTTILACATAVIAASPAVAAATGGVGATLPYVEVQAENASTNGTIIGPTAAYGTLADEASFRKAVTLQGTGKFVEFTTPISTNSIVFRYSIPDTGGGSVYTAPLSLYIGTAKQSNFTLTNAYSWYYGGYPFTNSPGSNPHHFYDEAHRLFGTTYPAGTTFRLQVDSEDTATSYTIDFADFENVGAALSQPSGSVSITNFGADPSGSGDSTAAFNSAISSAGTGGTVWIPPGTFRVPGHIMVNNVSIRGAGMWRSTVTGAAPGFYGNSAPSGSSGVHLADFAIFGDVQERNDGAQVNGIGGAMNNSTVDRLWIEHDKVGAWMDGPFTNLVFTGMRIRDVTADGVNFHGGVTNSKVTNSDLRNLGDDGLATWSDQAIGADANDSFDHDTVQYPILANGIAIYGGHDNVVADNRVIDAGLTQGGGIHVAQRFASTPLGRTDVLRNTLIRDGSLDPNWQFGVGALWFDARDAAMTGLTNVDNIVIQQSPYEAIQFVSGSSITNVQINNATIQNTGTFVVQEQVGGSARISNSTATGTQAASPVYSCLGGSFMLTDGGGNSGILGTPQCGFPTPTFPPYLPDPGAGVTISPSVLGFGTVATGGTSPAQTVTVANTTSSAVAVGSIGSTGDFSQTNTCGASIGAGSSCTVSVTFHPTAAGARTGTLTVTAGGTTNTVALSGTGVAPGPILSLDQSSLTYAGTVVGSSATQTVTVTNTGTTSATVTAITASGDFSQTNTCTTLAVGGSCTVTVRFSPTASGARTGTVSIASNANNSPTAIGLSGTGIGTDTNLALHQPATDSGEVGGFPAGNATDGDPNSYWESTNNAFPQWLQVDLGGQYTIGRVTLKLPPSPAWGTRTQTLSVQASTNGSTFTTAVGSAGYTFTSPTNIVNIAVPATAARYVRVNVTANTGWPAGQASEFEVYPSGATPPNSASLNTNPSSLTFASQQVNTTSAAQTVTVTNTGTAAATLSGISTSGDFSQTNTCGTSIAAGASCAVSVSFRPTASGTRAGSLTITSNATNSPSTVGLSGTGAGTVSTDLAAGKPTSESSHTDVYPSSNVTDGNQATYWESANNAFPQWVQVDLGSAQSASRVVLQLPAGWGARNQTLSVLGSTDGSNFTTIVGSATYTFNPSSNNTVTITFTATAQRYWRLNVTANTGWPAGQCSSFQVWNT
jgi:hypothetical protein